MTILCALMSSGASMIINEVALMPHWKSLSNTSEGDSSFVITIYNSLDLKAQLVRCGEKSLFLLLFKIVFRNQKVSLPAGPILDQVFMKKRVIMPHDIQTTNPWEWGKVKAHLITTWFIAVYVLLTYVEQIKWMEKNGN